MNDLTNVKPLSKTEAAYIAGFLDADGCIILQVKQRNNKETKRKKIHFHPTVGFANNRIKVLQWVQRKCGSFGSLKSKNKKFDRSFDLKFSSSAIRWLLPQLEPYLILKRGQAKLLNEYCQMTFKIKGGKIKSNLWLQNFKRYFQIYLNIRCLNNDISYGMIFKKSGELLESPKSNDHYNVIGNDERERVKSVIDWIISSQAYQNCMKIVGGKVHRSGCENTQSIITPRVPDGKPKI